MSNYFVNGGTPLTSIFKANYSGATQPNTNMKDDSGNDLSLLFQPQTGGASQITYDTNYSASPYNDLRYWFMDINYNPVDITLCGFNTDLSAFDGMPSSGATAHTTYAITARVVFTQYSTIYFTVNNFPAGQSIYYLLFGFNI